MRAMPTPNPNPSAQSNVGSACSHYTNGVYCDLLRHSTAPSNNLNTILTTSIRKHHPSQHLTVINNYTCDLHSFAAAGNATMVADPTYPSLKWRDFEPPTKRTETGQGVFADDTFFGRYDFGWQNTNFVVYEAQIDYMVVFYILSDSKTGPAATDRLIAAAGTYEGQLHSEMWVYDAYWYKNRTLYENVQKASWADVILDAEMKQALIADVKSFFGSREVYHEYAIPWKRGLIFYGPPGNGKTISLMALMHTLFPSTPSLYVKTIWGEGSVRDIFTKARAEAPCLLVLEDLDSLITEEVRSYFFNELDGLEDNDGVMIIGTTNHLDRLDPGLSKRPSRFDRKYRFPLPNHAERVQYCNYWRNKLKSNPAVDFPAKLSDAIADITDEFSFAYLKEAFLASLLVIARDAHSSNKDKDGDGDDELEGLLLWRVIKKQITALRKELGEAWDVACRING